MEISSDLRVQFGEIDIYLFDQLLRGRFDARPRILDAGSGSGRNLPFFLHHGFHVAAIDGEAAAVAAIKQLVPGAVQGELDALPWDDGTFDAVICSAVLHFARDDDHFEAMLDGAWRVLCPGGIFFSRLASSIGMEQRMRPVDGRRCLLPDGSERYLVDEAVLLEHTRRLGGALLDPIKTTIVQDQRCMTTWVMRKGVS